MRTIVHVEYQKIIDVTEKMCDEYCKWPAQTGSQEELNRFCDECPLNNIDEIEYPLGRNDWQE